MITDNEALKAARTIKGFECEEIEDEDAAATGKKSKMMPCVFRDSCKGCIFENKCPIRDKREEAFDVQEQKESGCLFSNSCKDCRFAGTHLCPDLWRQERELKQEQESKEDNINHPSHYTQGEIECIDAIRAAVGGGFEGYLVGNIIKYLWRYKIKGGVEDLKKARWYLDRLVAEVDGGGE